MVGTLHSWLPDGKEHHEVQVCARAVRSVAKCVQILARMLQFAFV